jgi:RHS repeat-associated protein
MSNPIRYGPYGENAKTTGSTYTSTIDPFLYQGGYHVAWGTSGTSSIPNDLHHYGERYYEPTTGRWSQEDPLGEGYQFDGDDPVNDVDPNGTLLDTLLEAAGKYLHAGEHFIFSDSLAKKAAIGTVLDIAGKVFFIVSVTKFANECANKLTGGGLEGTDPGSCNVLYLVLP